MTPADSADFLPASAMGRSRRLWSLMDGWLAGQLLGLVILSLALFTVIWIAPETLFRLTHILFDGKITPGQFGELLLYHLPSILEQSIPLAALFGSIFLFRRISHNLELTSLLNAGISPRRILMPIMAVGLLLTVCHIFLQETITPLTGPRYDVLREKAGISTTRPTGFTYVHKENGQWQSFFLMDDIQPAENNRPVKGVYVLRYGQLSSGRDHGGLYLQQILKADTALWLPEHAAWQLHNPLVYDLDEDGLLIGSHPSSGEVVAMPATAYELLTESLQNPKQMGFARLKRYVDLLNLNDRQQDQRYYAIRLVQKIVFPLTTLLFIAVGTMLGMERSRSRRHYAIIFGALLVFIHSIATPACTHIGQLGVLPPLLAALFPLGITLAAAIGLMSLRNRLEQA